jgi:hypothetical protein
VDATSSNEFPATNYASPEGGLSLADVQRATAIFASRPNMIALEVSTYNPTLDPDGSAAKVLVELLVSILAVRLATLESPSELAAEANAPAPTPPVQSEPLASESIAEPSTAESDSAAEPDNATLQDSSDSTESSGS